MTKPRIGITRSGSPERLPRTYQKYHDRIVEAGGEPVDLHAGWAAQAEGIAGQLYGLLLRGGADVQRERYGAVREPETQAGDPERDAFELALLAGALTRDLPVLAVCRGQQLLNVALGGRLIQHIAGDTHLPPGGSADPPRWHEVLLADGSKLAEILGVRRIETNSLHHQAVAPEAVAYGLQVTATAADGMVEGLESTRHRWVVAVQWHPEREEVADRFRPLFEAFVRVARAVPTH